MGRLGSHRVIAADQRDHLAQCGVSREQALLLPGQQLEAEQFGLGGEQRFDIGDHGIYSAAPATGTACRRRSSIISSVERTSANMPIRIANVALCSSSVRQAFASDMKKTL